MDRLTLKELAVPLIKAIDSFNYLLKSHHRRTAYISYEIGKKVGLNDDDMTQMVIAAALHDIGALSVQERDMLIKEDVENPTPHCLMGYRMLISFDTFNTIARIIKHHHIKYSDVPNADDQDVLHMAQIIHLADRVDVLTNSEKFILDQKKSIQQVIVDHSGTTFNPEYVDAFMEVSKSDIFWINVNNMTMEKVLNKIKFEFDYEMDIDGIVEFSRTISKIIDFRSRYTASHSCTVGYLAKLIGGLYGLDEVDCKKLLVAGLLHDLGKIGIEPGIIEKNGKLTDEEYNQIKLHPYYTEQILSDLADNDWFKDIIYWAKSHHENKHGTGYPFAHGESEFDEHIAILAYGDIISALMENRPYRKALSIERTFEIIGDSVVHKLQEDIFEIIKANKALVQNEVHRCQQATYDMYNKSLK